MIMTNNINQMKLEPGEDNIRVCVSHTYPHGHKKEEFKLWTPLLPKILTNNESDLDKYILSSEDHIKSLVQLSKISQGEKDLILLYTENINEVCMRRLIWWIKNIHKFLPKAIPCPAFLGNALQNCVFKLRGGLYVDVYSKQKGKDYCYNQKIPGKPYCCDFYGSVNPIGNNFRDCIIARRINGVFTCRTCTFQHNRNCIIKKRSVYKTLLEEEIGCKRYISKDLVFGDFLQIIKLKFLMEQKNLKLTQIRNQWLETVGWKDNNETVDLSKEEQEEVSKQNPDVIFPRYESNNQGIRNEEMEMQT